MTFLTRSAPACDKRLMRSPSAGWVGVPFSARFHFARSGRNPDGMLVEGLRMSQYRGQGPEEELARARFSHDAVMLDQVIELLRDVPEETLLDATVGGGGHAAALLDANPSMQLLGLDRDGRAVAAARERLGRFGDRAVVEQSRFDHFEDIMAERSVERLGAALFDLGVSSPQLDEAIRGFSYRDEAPLDMRMDQGSPLTAGEIVNRWPYDQLAS